MSKASPLDIAATMAEFTARRPAPRHSVASRPAPAIAATPSAAPPPFGTMRGQRVAYTVNLTPATVEALDGIVSRAPGLTTYGMVAVDAIRSTFVELHDPIGNGPPVMFPQRRVGAGRLSGNQPLVRKVFYVTPEEANAIEAARQALGGMEIGQLHRLAFDRYL